MSATTPPDRFAETHSAATVRGQDKPDLAQGEAVIRSILKGLPARPGVYRMLDASGTVLYVGKARSLKNRVASYTQTQRLPRRIQRMVALTRDMTIVTTDSEAAALLLEAQLIKHFRPAFNVLLRDDKSFPFIFLREDHDYPRMSKHRGARRGKGIFYGPFANAGAVNRTMNALQKIFLLRSCNDSFFANRTRPCLLYQIKRCAGPCADRISKDQYDELVADAKAFLSGQSKTIQIKLGEAMHAASDALDFELAGVYRDRLRALNFIQAQAQSGTAASDADIFALASKGGQVSIQAFFVRSGQNWGHRAFFPAQVTDVEETEILASFLMQFYEDMPPPAMVLVDRALPEENLLTEALSARAGRRITVRAPQRGANRKLVEQAMRNAAEALDRKIGESSTQAKLLTQLRDVFNLESIPQRIEVYDNSHIQGSHALGAMIVAGPEGFRKNAYRKFNIRDESITGGDDFAMMRHMLGRRFARLEREDPERATADWPDLLLIDGGKGQVSAVCEILGEMGIDDIAVVGVAKGPDRHAGQEVFHFPDGRELVLPPNDALLFYLQRLRDEAHRFVIGAHRAKRSKAITANPLDDVPGIGPARKRALLLHFGTAKSVRGATLAEIEKVPGISKATARTIFDHFHPQG